MTTTLEAAGAASASDAAAPSGGSVHLPRQPALDGLRGLAVAVVVVFHLERLQGGFLGVDLFFVLSGFLITSLLLRENRTRGAIDLGRFWVRRARRLLPALLVLLVGVAILLVAFTPEVERGGFRGDALATLGYVANWHRMLAATGYWEMFGQPSPLDHTWSLAIEEQFYLVWPLVAVLVLRRARGSARALGTVAGVLATLSFALLALLHVDGDTNRAYFGTDTRLGPILLGAALAAFLPPLAAADKDPGGRRGVEILGVACLGWMTLQVFLVAGTTGWYYRGGLALFALAAIGVVASVTREPGSPLAAVLSLWPLRTLGNISYGVYLWHWPVIVYMTPQRTNIDGLALDALRVAVTLAVSGASYVLVEQPIRHGALSGIRIRFATVGAVAVTLVAVVVATRPVDDAVTAAGALEAPEQFAGADTAYLHVPGDVAAGQRKVLLVGDSGVQALGPTFVQAGAEADLAVAFSVQYCSAVFVQDEPGLWMPEEEVVDRYFCPSDRFDAWRRLVAEYDPDVVVYYLANAGGNGKEKLDGEWVWDCDPAYDAYVQEAFRTDADMLGANGATVVFATSPYPDAPLEDSRERVDCRNDSYRAVAEARDGTQVVELEDVVSAADDDGRVLLSDGLHLSADGAREVSDWLVGEIEAVSGR